jgi:O-antigen ligase
VHAKKHFPEYCYGLIALLVLIIGVASLQSAARGIVFPLTLRTLFFLLIACSLSILLPCNFETLTRLFLYLGLTGTVISVLTLVGAACSRLGLEWLAFAVDRPNYMYGLPQVVSFFKNPNGLGFFLVFSIAGAIILFALLKKERGESRLLTLLFYLALAVQLFTLILTFSRAAFIALALFVLCFVWFSRRRCCYTPSLVLLSTALFMSKQAFEKGGPGEIVSALFTGRIQLWGEGVNLLLRHPLFGTGLGGWFALTSNELSLHNTYLHVAVELGLVGLIVYLAFIVLFMQGLHRAMNRSLTEPSRYALLSGLYSLSVGLLVHQFFESYLYQGLPLFLLVIIPLQALLREPARLYRLREPVWKGQEAAWFYRRAS